MNNQIQAQRPKFSSMIQSTAFQKSLHNALSNINEIQKFTAAITSVVSTNPNIEECDASTILSAALCGHSLGLVPSPQLGQYYMVPFKDKKRNRTVATFVLGYKGYIQLAIRSGQYKKLNVLEIKEGELINWDPLTEDISIKLIDEKEEMERQIDIQQVTDNGDELLLFIMRQWLSDIGDVDGGVRVFKTSQEVQNEYQNLLHMINSTKEEVNQRIDKLYDYLLGQINTDSITNMDILDDIICNHKLQSKMWKKYSSLIFYLYQKYSHTHNDTAKTEISSSELGAVSDAQQIDLVEYNVPTYSAEYILYRVIMELAELKKS